MYNLTLKTAPLIEPIDLFDLLGYLRIGTDDIDITEKTYIQSLITTARKYCENFQNRAYITQTWYMSLDYWEDAIITIPKGNLQLINSIKYTDYLNVTVTMTPTTDYVVSTKGLLGRVTSAYGKTFPSFTPTPLDAIIIDFTCGYGLTIESVPEPIRQAMYLLVSHWYENRVPLADKMTVPDELNFAVSALLWQERIINI